MEFYQKESEVVLKEVNTHKFGLTTKDAESRLKEYGLNVIKKTMRISPLSLFISSHIKPICLDFLIQKGINKRVIKKQIMKDSIIIEGIIVFLDFLKDNLYLKILV